VMNGLKKIKKTFDFYNRCGMIWLTKEVDMIVYKLFRKMKDGSIAPLFIHKKDRYEIGKWETAKKGKKVKGFKYNPFFHSCSTPSAPHLSENNREWYVCSIRDFSIYERPDNQGGIWYLSEKMKVLGTLRDFGIKHTVEKKNFE